MLMQTSKNNVAWDDALRGLKRGDFSHLDPLFQSVKGSRPQIEQWVEQGLFRGHDQELAEALTCACFNGRNRSC